MGQCFVSGKVYARDNIDSLASEKESVVVGDNNQNVHMVQPDIQIHTMISNDLDYDHHKALDTALGETSDEQLLAELSERGINVENLNNKNGSFDFESHQRVLRVPLEAVTDDELVTEIARRKLDIHAQVDEQLVTRTYQMEAVLGHGASGKVFRCSHKQTKVEYACKVIQMDARMNDAQSMGTEVEIMKRLRHENVVSMYELYQSSKCLWLILELVDGGDLKSFLHHNRATYTEKHAAVHMKQMCSGVHYLHSLGIVHRDLKLENILLKKVGDQMIAKIADFGLSALVRIGEDGYHNTKSSKRKDYDGLHEPWGTAEYESPELLMGAYGPQADMWAMGCILYEILCGHKAFSRREGERNLAPLHERIKKREVEFKMALWWKVSSNGRNLVEALICVDPTKRLTATQVLKHKWIRQNTK